MQVAVRPKCLCAGSHSNRETLFPQHYAASPLRAATSVYTTSAVAPSSRLSQHRHVLVPQWAKQHRQEAHPEAADLPVMASSADCTPQGFIADHADATGIESAAANPDAAVRGSTSAAISPNSNADTTSKDFRRRVKQQQRLLRQLLNSGSISSMSSVDSAELDNAPMLPALQQQQHRQQANVVTSGRDANHDATVLNQTAAAAGDAQNAKIVDTEFTENNTRSGSKPAQRRHMPQGLYDDDSAVDYDPIMLDLLGFTSVAQYLQYKLDTAVKQAKVDCIAAALWAGLAYAVLTNMGGHAAYMQHFRELTLNGSASDNLMFLWVYILGYFTMKGCVMSLATGWRAMTARQAEPEKVQELETLQAQHQRLAFWQLQEKLDRLDDRANRTFTEFALASTLLGVLMFMRGGLDNLLLQMETVDQEALSALVVMMWLFWESYFTGIGALVQLVQVATSFVEKWQHKTKWEKDVDTQ